MGLMLVTLLGFAPAAGAAVVPTSDPLDLSAAGANAGDGRIAFDPSGRAVIVFVRVDADGHQRIQLRSRTWGGAFSAAQTLSAAGRDARDPRIAVDAGGGAIIIWQRYDGADWRVQAVRRSPSGSLSVVQTLSTSGQDAEDAQVAVDAAGSASVVWVRWDGTYDRVQLRRRSAGGTLGSITTLSAAGNAADPRVLVDAKANAYVTWTASDGSNSRIRLRRRSATGTLSSIVTLSGSGHDAQNGRLSSDAAGNVSIVWERHDGSNWRIELRHRSAAGSFDAAVPLSEAGQDAVNADVATTSGGTVVVWERFDGTAGRIQAVRRSATGTLSSVQTLSEAGQTAMSARVGADAAGNAIVAWRRWDGANFRVQTVRRGVAGGLDPVETLSAAGQQAAVTDLAMDLKGNAFVAWNRHDGTNDRVQGVYLIQAQTMSPSGASAGSPEVAVSSGGNALLAWWMTPYLNLRGRAVSGAIGALTHLTSGAAPAQNQQVAFDAGGNAYITFIQPDSDNHYRVKLVRRSAAGTLGAVVTLSAAGQNASEPRVAIDGSGRVYVAWTRSDGQDYRVQIRRRSVSGTWTATQTLSAAGESALWPHLAVDATGNALVVWSRFDGIVGRVQVRRRAASGTLSTIRTLSAAGQNASEPRVAMDSGGGAVIVWVRSDGTNARVQGVRRTAGGTWSSVKTLSAAGQDAMNVEVAADGSGNAVVVWARSDGSNTRIELARRSAGGTVSAVQQLSASGQDANVPDIAIDGYGRAVITWTRSDGVTRRVQAVRRSSTGSLGPIQTISPAGQDAGDTTYNGPRLALNRAGTVVIITWYGHDDPINVTVFAARV